MKLPIAVVYLLYKSSCFRYDWSGNCLHPRIPYIFFLLAWYYDDKKHFCSFLTDLTTFHTVIIFVSSKVPSAMICKQSEWDVKRINKDIKVCAKVLWKHFLIMQKQPFADVLQNWSSLKFHNIHKKIMCWSLFSIKLQAEKPESLSENP